MPGQVVHVDVRARESGAQVVGAFDVAACAERIDPLDVHAVGDPAFAAKQYPHQPTSLSWGSTGEWGAVGGGLAGAAKRGTVRGRRTGGLPDDQLHRQYLGPGRVRRPGQPLEQQFDADLGQSVDRRPDGGQPRPHVLAEPDVVEADDRQVLGHPDAVCLGGGQHAEGDVVAGHERRGGRLGRGEQPGQRAGPELLGEVAGQVALVVRVDAALDQRVAVAAPPLLATEPSSAGPDTNAIRRWPSATR